MSRSRFQGQARLREVQSLASSQKTEQGHDQKQTQVSGLPNQGCMDKAALAAKSEGWTWKGGFPNVTLPSRSGCGFGSC